MIAPSQPPDSLPLDNERIARRLDETADLLEHASAWESDGGKTNTAARGGPA